jgi:hypothetical protein
MLSGRVRIVEWNEGQEPILEVTKRGRFITNMGFANFVTAAVDSGDERIKGSPWSSSRNPTPAPSTAAPPPQDRPPALLHLRPRLQLRVPASRIVGGYTVQDGKIIPNYSHGEVIEAVFRRTRVTVGVMTSAKLLSAVEPLIRYHRDRFRGGGAVPQAPPAMNSASR